MKARKRSLAVSLVMVAAITAVAPQSSFGAGEGRAIAIVVAKSFPMEEMSFGDLKRLYLGNTIVAGGKTLVPLTYPKNTPERRIFDSAVLGMSTDEVGRYWIDRRIRGQSGPPKSIESADVALRVISKLSGALGFVRADATSQDVKVLKIDGKLPGDPGYRVR
jgi:hypothetical protein